MEIGAGYSQNSPGKGRERSAFAFVMDRVPQQTGTTYRKGDLPRLEEVALLLSRRLRGAIHLLR